MRVKVESKIESTSRVEQVRGMFDIPTSAFADVTWDIEEPPADGWSIGLITGPSGSGKSTIADALFGDSALWTSSLPNWSKTKAVVDGFPETLPLRDVTEILSSVGFSSPPAWLQSFATLSTGQQFRCEMARLLAHATPTQVAVMDEFTSVVDRTVAQVGSAAIAKAVRRRGLKFVAVTCHEDVIDWLQPDWILTPENGKIARRTVQQRPHLDFTVFRTPSSSWSTFARHHYLSHTISPASTCFVMVEKTTQRPVAFSAWLNHLSAKGGKREHRTVVLPDWQGIGIGMAISGFIASMWSALGFRATSTTTHPAFISARRRSKLWKMHRAPGFGGNNDRKLGLGHAETRLTAGFTYIGSPMDPIAASNLLGQR